MKTRTRKELAHAAWTKAWELDGTETSARRALAIACWKEAGVITTFDAWWVSRARVVSDPRWQCPPLILAVAAWNGARGRDALVTMPPEDGYAFEKWYATLSLPEDPSATA